MNNRHQGATTVIHPDITDHQRHLSNRSPPALGHSPSNPLLVHLIISTMLPLPQTDPVQSDETFFFSFFFTTLYFKTSAICRKMLGSFYKSCHLQCFYCKHWAFGPGLHLIHTFPRCRQSQRVLRLLGWSGFYEHKQLFKPRLFTDNLLTIQLFILRQRPSPSHKQMKSNKTLGKTYTHIIL